MSIKTYIPWMFHRRLLLVGTGIGLSLIPLGVQLARLTLVKGASLRTQAESRLVRSSQTPTVRGSIIDRKGRVLAQDRPSYDIGFDYGVITGDWARLAARQAARRAAGSAWGGMSAAAQEEATGPYLAIYAAHLDRAWDLLATTLGVTRAEVERRRDDVVKRITSRQKSVWDARLAKELEALRSGGTEPTEAQVRAARRRAEQPISETSESHVLFARVGDDAGFACQLLADEDVALAMPPAADRLNVARADVTLSVPRVPGLRVRDSGDRDYPFESLEVTLDRKTFPTPLASDQPLVVPVTGVATAILGNMRDQVYGTREEVRDGQTVRTLGDADRRAQYLAALGHAGAPDLGSYRDGDRVGATGLEGSREDELRGMRGVATARLDTGRRDVVAPVKGKDVHLTLDIALQARVQAVMSAPAGLAVVQPWHKQESATQPIGTTLNGAAVVLDIETSDILAMVSMPTVARDEMRSKMAELVKDEVNTPLVNRAVAKYYTPGSIVKPLLLCEAVKRGVYGLEERIDCTGHLFERQPNAFRCWIYKKFHRTHTDFLGHPLSAEEGIMVSCNIFFFTLGKRLGPEGIIAAYEDFGVGRTFQLGVGGEAPGRLGFRREAAHFGLESWDAIQMGIGQGPVTWTPMHAASAYATLARGGIEVPVRLVSSAPRREGRDLGLASRTIEAALEGLRLSANDVNGTGNHISVADAQGNEHPEPIFNLPGVSVWGKTGTAAAPKIIINDPDGPNGPLKGEVAEEGDHSWFVVLVGRGRPQYVIAVVIDYGGSGGKVSGPICNQIAWALVAEGYL